MEEKCKYRALPFHIVHIDVQPDDYFDYYGFSRYARELNELTPELEAVLPPTDTRFRPDQRFTAVCPGFPRRLSFGLVLRWHRVNSLPSGFWSRGRWLRQIKGRMR